jgi:hypothetical protein
MEFTKLSDANPEQRAAALAQLHEMFCQSKQLGEALDLATESVADRSVEEAAIDHWGSIPLSVFEDEYQRSIQD